MPWWGLVIIITVIVVGILIALYFVGNKLQKSSQHKKR